MESELLDWLLDAIKSVGFPIVVAGWLLFRDAKLVREYTKALTALQVAIAGLSELVRQHNDGER